MLSVVTSVNGLNETETVQELLASGLVFSNLSINRPNPNVGWHWGALACFLSHVRALRFQLERRTPFVLTIEDDVELQPSFIRYMHKACDHYERLRPQPSLLSLSQFNEVRVTTLDGAASILNGMKRHGITKNSDQTLLDPNVNERSHTVRRVLRSALADGWGLPWTLARKTNNGFIRSTKRMTQGQVNLLRLLTARGAIKPSAKPVQDSLALGNVWARRILSHCCGRKLTWGLEPETNTELETAGANERVLIDDICSDWNACQLAAGRELLSEIAGWRLRVDCGERSAWRVQQGADTRKSRNPPWTCVHPSDAPS